MYIGVDLMYVLLSWIVGSVFKDAVTLPAPPVIVYLNTPSMVMMISVSVTADAWIRKEAVRNKRRTAAR